MKQEIKIPERAIVFITGPSCAGKSTLAERIIAEAPTTSKGLVSVDRVVQQILAEETPDKAVGSLELTECGLKFAEQRYNERLKQVMTEAVTKASLVILDLCLLELSPILSNAIWCERMRPGERVILLKLCPEPELLIDFFVHRPVNTRPFIPILANQLDLFEAVFRTDLGQLIPNLTDYAISDPREVELVWD